MVKAVRHCPCSMVVLYMHSSCARCCFTESLMRPLVHPISLALANLLLLRSLKIATNLTTIICVAPYPFGLRGFRDFRSFLILYYSHK